MRLHDLKPAPGSHRDRKRVGRGNASGHGTTGNAQFYKQQLGEFLQSAPRREM